MSNSATRIEWSKMNVAAFRDMAARDSLLEVPFAITRIAHKAEATEDEMKQFSNYFRAVGAENQRRVKDAGLGIRIRYVSIKSGQPVCRSGGRLLYIGVVPDARYPSGQRPAFMMLEGEYVSKDKNAKPRWSVQFRDVSLITCSWVPQLHPSEQQADDARHVVITLPGSAKRYELRNASSSKR